jgi:hypothetical protein
MTQDEIIEMAQECNLIGMRPHLDGIYTEALVAFAKLVAAKTTAKEREVCAKLCDELVNKENSSDYQNAANWCSVRIRARGEQA